jgi:hypothetical protein
MLLAAVCRQVTAATSNLVGSLGLRLSQRNARKKGTPSDNSHNHNNCKIAI